MMRLQAMGQAAALDDPVWAALTTEHRGLAEGGPLAWRYPAEVAPFAAIADRTARSFAALARLLPAERQVALATADRLAPPAVLAVDKEQAVLQMILEKPLPAPRPGPEPLLLGAADVAEMLALAGRTRPGPFGPRTIELGRYIGIRAGGALVAMAGERMRFDRFVEISAVCVDPAFRGQGYAGLLLSRLAARIQGQALTPILHVFAENEGAIALYDKLGFATRRRLTITILHAA